MTEDAKRTEAIRKFYKAYRELQKYDTIRLHTHEGIGDEVLIEAHRYYGEKKGACVLRVKRETEEEAYEQAIYSVESMLEKIKTTGRGKA